MSDFSETDQQILRGPKHSKEDLDLDEELDTYICPVLQTFPGNAKDV